MGPASCLLCDFVHSHNLSGLHLLYWKQGMVPSPVHALLWWWSGRWSGNLCPSPRARHTVGIQRLLS